MLLNDLQGQSIRYLIITVQTTHILTSEAAMLIDPYSATVTRAYGNIAKVRQEVERAAIEDGVRSGIYVVADGDTRVASFSQPLLFNVPSSKEPLVAIDYRPFKGAGGYAMEQKALAHARAALTLHAAKEKSCMELYSSVAQVAYASILSGIVANRFGIEPQMRIQLSIVAAAQYFNLTHDFDGKGGYNDREQQMLASNLVKNLRVTMGLIDATLPLLDNGHSLETFVENVRAVDGTDRTRSLNTGIMVNGSNDLWYGQNSTELVALSYEHAPTFCAMLYMALGETGYSRSEFARRLKYNSFLKQKSDYFMASMRTIIESVV